MARKQRLQGHEGARNHLKEWGDRGRVCAVRHGSGRREYRYGRKEWTHFAEEQCKERIAQKRQQGQVKTSFIVPDESRVTLPATLYAL